MADPIAATDTFGRATVDAGVTLLVVGLCTVAWWLLRLRGRSIAPRGLVIVGRAALLVTVVLGLLTELPHVAHAMGLRI